MERKNLQIRLPNDLHEALDALAKKNHRSKASQVTAILEGYVKQLDTTGTQVNMPTDAGERERMLERIR